MMSVAGLLGTVGVSGWQWIVGNRGEVWSRFLEHVELTVIAVVVGFVISFPLAVWAHRNRRVYAPITWVAGLLYTIPSLALFVILIPITGLTVLTAEIGLISYTLLILIRNIVAGLSAVPEDVKEAARGMGYTNGELLWHVELPLALPAIMAGIRIATVSTIGLVTVAALIGKGGLGQFILEGLQTFFQAEILTGTVLSFAFALAADGLLLLAERALTPWARGRTTRVRPFATPRKAGFPVT